MKFKFATLFFPVLVILFSCSDGLTEFSYYKNLPEITGTTRDDPPLFYIIKVDLGYKWGDKKTQYSLASIKPVLKDGIRNLFSSKMAMDFEIEQEKQLKKDIIEVVNSSIHRYDSYKRVPGIKTVAIVKKQVFEFR